MLQSTVMYFLGEIKVMNINRSNINIRTIIIGRSRNRTDE